FGDGIAFFLSPNNLSSSSSSSTTTTTFGLPTNFVAVEFNTRFDPRFNDPNENHIGFDIDTLNSLKTVDPIYNGIDLKSGNTNTYWIDYKTDVNSLLVFFFLIYSPIKPRDSPIKPRDPIIFVTVDLSEYFRGNDGVSVGFSSSAEKSTELHQIESWSFYTVRFEPARPRLRSHNVSDKSVSVSTGNEVHVNGSRSHLSSKKRFGFGFAVAGPAFFCVVFSLLGYYSFMKWKGVRKGASKNFGTGFVACPREFDYRELKSVTREFHPSRIVGHG
ncbi:putative L-type lectin-domain containing receptor kinase, partial [Trifolium medium]|nr:putative L-type lectin-domain containing receptor kinase [Trifolium medium]